MPLLCSVFDSNECSRINSPRELLNLLDASVKSLFEWQVFDGSAFKCMPAGASFFLEKSFKEMALMSSFNSLGLNFDIRSPLNSATALGKQTIRATCEETYIRRLLKPSVLTSGTDIPFWQELVEGKEWRQCNPGKSAKLESDIHKRDASPHSTLFRRLLLRPGSIGDQMMSPLTNEPYLTPALPSDLAMMATRVHESLA